mgnify:FL=1
MKMLLKFKWFAIIAVCLLAGSVVSAQDRNQQITVSGTVTDARGEPLVGAMVLVKGTQIGSAVDPQGRYSIRTDASATLVASLMGYKAAEEPVRGRSSIDFQMQRSEERV